jgi:hypothetical protein
MKIAIPVDKGSRPTPLGLLHLHQSPDLIRRSLRSTLPHFLKSG